MSASMQAPDSATKAMRWLEKKMLYSMGFGVFVLLAIGVGIFYYQRAQDAQPKVLRIGYGSGGPVRRHFLEQLARHGKSRNLDIRLVVTEGTVETIDKIESGETDLGLITGAIEGPRADRILEIMPLYMEPLQLLIKAPLYEAVSQDFGQLRGKTIALDGQLSATNLVASELMQFIGLIDAAGTRHYTPVHMQQPELVALKDRDALPDAIFQIGGLPSQTIRHFIVNHDYRLVQLPFGSSFNLEKFRQDASSADPDLTELEVDRAFVEEFVIPAYSYSVLPPVPPEDTRTIASRLVKVGGNNLDNHTVHKLIDLILSPEIADLVRPTLKVALLDEAFQFSRHPGTDQYVDSLKPIDVDGAFTNWGRLVEVWGIVIAAYVTVVGGLKRWKQKRMAEFKSVSDFLLEVIAVEAEATASCTPAERTALDQRLTDIKRSAIEMHLEERLEDAESLPSLLVTLADTRTRIWGPVS
ncbi:MAG TPA: TAXI family TRAP transporter solute-binding subunit [Vicinamibacterales bacterium]|nr:TAXI family TRAP transporter solute-binding subunit [Vicinamibacterales bacterium]